MRFRSAISTVLAAVLLTTGTVPATANIGVNLLWDDCYQGGGRFVNHDACDAARTLIVSVETDQLLDQINGAQGIIYASFDSGDIPDYWRVDAGACRSGQLAADGNVGSGSPPYSCAEPWSQVGGQVFAVNFAPYFGCNNRARIAWIIAVPSPHTVIIDPAIATEWYLMKLVFVGGQTSCSGCAVGGCFYAEQTRLTRPLSAGGDYFIYEWATWGAPEWGTPTFPCVASGGGGPPCPTPVSNSTWGQIKSMYR